MTLLGLIMLEIWRIAEGPKREPVRYELPVSKGMPKTAKSIPVGSSMRCMRIKLPVLQKRGDEDALGGCMEAIKTSMFGPDMLGLVMLSTALLGRYPFCFALRPRRPCT